MGLGIYKLVQTWILKHTHTLCINEVKDKCTLKHNKFISWVLMKQHVSAYSEAIS